LTDRNGLPLAELLDAVVPVKGRRGRALQRPGKLHADKAYDAKRCRQRGIEPRIARRGIQSSERLGRHRWVVEIVCTQMTKTNVFAARAGGNDITNLDLAVFDDDPVNEKLDQLALLREVSVRQSTLDTRAEILNGDGKAGNLFMTFSLGT
jgi:hypothetical protein